MQIHVHHHERFVPGRHFWRNIFSVRNSQYEVILNVWAAVKQVDVTRINISFHFKLTDFSEKRKAWVAWVECKCMTVLGHETQFPSSLLNRIVYPLPQTNIDRLSFAQTLRGLTRKRCSSPVVLLPSWKARTMTVLHCILGKSSINARGAWTEYVARMPFLISVAAKWVANVSSSCIHCCQVG